MKSIKEGGEKGSGGADWLGREGSDVLAEEGRD